MWNKNLIALVIPVLLGACTSMAPSYERPDRAVAASWPTGAAYGSPANEVDDQRSAADIPWRAFILDERLRQVVELALANSRDLRKTIANIESARAQYGVQRAAQLPTVTAGVSGSRTRSLSSGTSGGENSSAQSQSYSASLGLSAYELDLFGRVRSLTNAAQETYLATEEAARTTRISLIAETASAWLALAADRSQLAITQHTLESAQRSMELAQRRQQAGVSSGVDVRQAETVYQQARVDLASSTTAVAQDRNALELLVGSPVADTLLPDTLPLSESCLVDVPAGLSSTVLLQRPDVLQAEHQLKAANANIGAARAAFFPKLSLTASGGLASAALSTLFSGGATVWSLAPALSVSIFDGGSSRASLAYSEAQKKLYLATYELAVQTAFSEVANALARRGTMQAQLSAQADLVTAATDSYRLAEARYAKGVDTYINALDAQRTLYSAEKTLVATRLTALNNQLSLYRVLGGGSAGGDTASATEPAPDASW